MPHDDCYVRPWVPAPERRRAGANMSMNLHASDPGILGKYHLVAELGQGGMARVYLAVVRGPAEFAKLVVLKVLRRELADETPDLSEMFLSEARLAARMQHPNVVQTLEIGEAANRVFLVMEYLDGQPLHRVLRRARRVPLAWSISTHLRVLSEALAGLHYAHELRDFDGTSLDLVHRDVSPQNVFLTYDGQIKLMDFGVAKAGVCEPRTRAGVVKGKIAYMAPEQAEGSPVDRRADVFSAGVMLYEALSGERLWKGQTEASILRALVAARLPDVHTALFHAPQRLRLACAKALALDPAARFQTAAELQHEIEEWLERSGTNVSPKIAGRAADMLFEQERRDVHDLLEQRMRSLESFDPAPLDGNSFGEAVPSWRPSSSSTPSPSWRSTPTSAESPQSMVGSTPAVALAPHAEGRSDGPRRLFSRTRATFAAAIASALGVGAVLLVGVLGDSRGPSNGRGSAPPLATERVGRATTNPPAPDVELQPEGPIPPASAGDPLRTAAAEAAPTPTPPLTPPPAPERTGAVRRPRVPGPARTVRDHESRPDGEALPSRDARGEGSLPAGSSVETSAGASPTPRRPPRMLDSANPYR